MPGILLATGAARVRARCRSSCPAGASQRPAYCFTRFTAHLDVGKPKILTVSEPRPAAAGSSRQRSAVSRRTLARRLKGTTSGCSNQRWRRIFRRQRARCLALVTMIWQSSSHTARAASSRPLRQPRCRAPTLSYITSAGGNVRLAPKPSRHQRRSVFLRRS